MLLMEFIRSSTQTLVNTRNKVASAICLFSGCVCQL